MRSCYLNLVNRIEIPTIVAQELVKILNKLKLDISQSHFDKDEIDYLNCKKMQRIISHGFSITYHTDNLFNDFNHQLLQNSKVPLKKTGFRGRPFLIITKEQLQLYLQSRKLPKCYLSVKAPLSLAFRNLAYLSEILIQI